MWPVVILALAIGAISSRDRIEIGEWEVVSDRGSRPPVNEELDLQLTTLEPGTGRAIRAGDLVELEIVVHRSCKRDPALEPETSAWGPMRLWLWTGTEPGLPSSYVPDNSGCRDRSGCERSDLWAEESRWGRLGSRPLRRALVGRSVGETVELRQGANGRGYPRVPLYGFAAERNNSTLNDDRSPRWYPDIVPAGRPRNDGNDLVWADLHILNVCAGRLLRRRGVVEGYEITWSALEGSQCATSDQNVRLEIGPLHFELYDPFEGSNWGWRNAYSRARPPAKYPQEYAIERPRVPAWLMASSGFGC